MKLPRGLWPYLLWQLPGWVVLALFLILSLALFGLPTWIGVIVLTLFVVKDLLMFRVVQGVLRPSDFVRDRLIGARGRAIEPLAPVGYVRVTGEIWKAEARDPDTPIPAGSEVLVVDLRRLTLVVEKEADHRTGETSAPRAEDPGPGTTRPKGC